MPNVRTTIVMISKDRRVLTCATLERIRSATPAAPVVMIDDGSGDGTAAAVRASFPGVRVVRHEVSRGSAARNVGVRMATTPYVAFADDDSWWAPGALDVAADVLDGAPAVALVAGRVLVGQEQRLDPTSRAMRAAAARCRSAPERPAVLGFLACGAVVRRDAFLAVGGFPDGYGVGGEEAPLAYALAGAGWELAYVDEAVAHHHPGCAPGRQAAARRRRQLRNDLVTTWRYRRWPGVAVETARLARAGLTDPGSLAGFLDAIRAAPAVLRDRRPLPAPVEAARRAIDAEQARA